LISLCAAISLSLFFRCYNLKLPLTSSFPPFFR
jgi:hypothetical protein